jgi:hypothetical protein
MIKRSPWIALGAASAWFFFDTTHGAERRAQARQRVSEMFGAQPPGPDVISAAG